MKTRAWSAGRGFSGWSLVGVMGCHRLAAVLTALVLPVPAALAAPDTLELGVPYVVPAHAPGARVRTPEGPVHLLTEHLGKTLAVSTQVVDAAEVATALSQKSLNAALVPIDAGTSEARGVVTIPLGYRAGIMAIMRTDTDIHSWEALRGRTVCLAEGSGLAGRLHERYGAHEKVHLAPADALLDLRIGGCDATVHDSVVLTELLELPEWKKFSAQLPVQDERELAFVVPAGDTRLAERLREYVKDWQQSGLLERITRQSARDIAFEVYLDQEVPDCH